MSERNRLKDVAWPLLQMTVVAAAAVGAYHGIVAKEADASPAAGIQAIVVVDTQALVQGKIDQASEQIASGQSFTQDQLTMQGQNFGTEMLRALKEYRDRGVLVIDRRHALAIPVGADATERVAARLGVKAKSSPDPFSAPSLE
jgi:hypothetical protein